MGVLLPCLYVSNNFRCVGAHVWFLFLHTSTLEYESSCVTCMCSIVSPHTLLSQCLRPGGVEYKLTWGIYTITRTFWNVDSRACLVSCADNISQNYRILSLGADAVFRRFGPFRNVAAVVQKSVLLRSIHRVKVQNSAHETHTKPDNVKINLPCALVSNAPLLPILECFQIELSKCK